MGKSIRRTPASPPVIVPQPVATVVEEPVVILEPVIVQPVATVVEQPVTATIKDGVIDPVQPIWGKAGEWIMYQQPCFEVKVIAPEAVVVKVERSVKIVPDQNQPDWGKGEWWTFKKREVVTMEREKFADRIDEDDWEQNAIDIISGRIQEI